MPRPKVIIETPYKDTEKYTRQENTYFAIQVCFNAILEGFNPFASHLFYPRFLDDTDTEERLIGINCGLAWGAEADAVWFCLREGEEMSSGMAYAYSHYKKLGLPCKVILCEGDGEFIAEIEK